MKFQTQAKVMGAKKFCGTVEGQNFDSTTLFIETELDTSKEVALGFAVAEYKFGTSAEFDKMKHLTFPFIADLTVELTTTGKRENKAVLAMKPIAAVREQAKQ